MKTVQSSMEDMVMNEVKPGVQSGVSNRLDEVIIFNPLVMTICFASIDLLVAS